MRSSHARVARRGERPAAAGTPSSRSKSTSASRCGCSSRAASASSSRARSRRAVGAAAMITPTFDDANFYRVRAEITRRWSARWTSRACRVRVGPALGAAERRGRRRQAAPLVCRLRGATAPRGEHARRSHAVAARACATRRRRRAAAAPDVPTRRPSPPRCCGRWASRRRAAHATRGDVAPASSRIRWRATLRGPSAERGRRVYGLCEASNSDAAAQVDVAASRPSRRPGGALARRARWKWAKRTSRR